MTTKRDAVEIVSDWLTVFRAVKAEITPQVLVDLSNLRNSTNDESHEVAIATGLAATRIVFANDRTAAVVAAMLTQSGVSRPVFTTDGETE